jgi:hypothetical protein
VRCPRDCKKNFGEFEFTAINNSNCDCGWGGWGYERIESVDRKCKIELYSNVPGTVINREIFVKGKWQFGVEGFETRINPLLPAAPGLIVPYMPLTKEAFLDHTDLRFADSCRGFLLTRVEFRRILNAAVGIGGIWRFSPEKRENIRPFVGAVADVLESGNLGQIKRVRRDFIPELRGLANAHEDLLAEVSKLEFLLKINGIKMD